MRPAEIFGDARDVELVDRRSLFARLLTPVLGRVAGIGSGHRRRVEQQPLGEMALFFGDGGEALQLLRVDDGEIETGFCAVIKEDRVDDFARRCGQAERDIRDAEHRLDVRDLLLDQPDGFDRLDRAADVVLIARGAGKDQRIDDDVFGRNAVFVGEQIDRTLRHGQFAFAREGLGLQLVFVDGADDQRGAVAFASGQMRSNFSSPSSRLIELMMLLPWQ